MSPREAFVAANSKAVIGNLDHATPKALRKRINKLSLNQIDRYVFIADEGNLVLVKKCQR